MVGRNPHAGEPFDDDDEAIAAALEDVSVPALLCSLVHMTGDPSWIRGDDQPRVAVSHRVPGSDARRRARRGAPPGTARDRRVSRRGLRARTRSRTSCSREMMEFLGCRPVGGSLEGMFMEDMQFDGADAGAISWGDEIPAEVKAASPVVVIGCGESGILAGIRLAQAGLPFTIIEKNDGPGGTWWENRYPGARVDVGSHQYCYSFEPATTGASTTASSRSSATTSSSIVDKYGLPPHCRFGTTVTSVDLGRVRRRGGGSRVRGPDGAEEVLEARFVISAVGSLNLPRLPDIPGMESFAGPSFHSARWPDGLDITGTRFALIGAGATGFQIAPTIADRVEQLTIFQRTAQWIIPNPMYHATVPPGDRWALRHLPFYARWFRFLMTFPGIAIGTEQYRHRPGATTTPRARRSTRPTRSGGTMLAAWMQLGARRPSGPDREVARPTIRPWASACCRTTARGCVA